MPNSLKILIAAALLIFPSALAAQETKVCIEGRCLQAELADTPSQRIKGLMSRDVLEEGRAMLFVFPESGMHGIWMKNMKFALDIIWLDAEKRVVFVKEDALPCGGYCPSIIPDKKALYVLEVNSGFCAKYGIKAGDKAEF